MEAVDAAAETDGTLCSDSSDYSAVNLYMYALLNEITGRVELVYDSNVQLNELSESLNQVHGNMKNIS